MDELAAEIEKYGLDGFDIDDEWSSTQSTSQGLSVDVSRYSNNIANNSAIWRNYAEFIHGMRQRLGPDKIISVYEWAATRRGLPADATAHIGPATGTLDEHGYAEYEEVLITDYLYDLINFSNQASYGSYLANSYFGVPRHKYAPGANGFHNRSMISNANIQNYLTAGLQGNPYWGILWYGMTSQAKTRAAGRTTNESWMNFVSSQLFGQNVIYIGPDYPQDWAKW